MIRPHLRQSSQQTSQGQMMVQGVVYAHFAGLLRLLEMVPGDNPKT